MKPANIIQEKGAFALGEMMKRNKILQTLNLSLRNQLFFLIFMEILKNYFKIDYNFGGLFRRTKQERIPKILSMKYFQIEIS